MRTNNGAGADEKRSFARIGLVLIFTLLLSIFMYEGWYKPKFVDAAPTSNGRLVYSINTTTAQNRVYSVSTNTFGAQTATVTGATNQSFFVNRASKTRTENIAGYVTTGGVLYIHRWNGTAWSAEWNVTVGGNGVDGRRFDIAYENTTGNAMVVYSTNATGTTGNEMAYRIWNGATWTAPTNINSARFAQAAAVTWIKMKARPTAGSNEIALTAADTGTTTANTAVLTSFIWNGTTWTEPAAAHTTATTGFIVNTTGQLVQNDCFDLAYESLSGDLMVVFTTNTPQQYYITYTAGAWAANATSLATARAVPLQMVAESNPNTDQVMILFNRSANANVYGIKWTGTAMGAVTSIGATGMNPSIESKRVAGQWLNVGGTDFAVAMWQHTTTGTFGYNFTSGATTTWGTAATYVSGTTATANWMEAVRDPQGADTMMLNFSTGTGATGSLWAKRLVLTAGPTFTWTNADGGAALATALTGTRSQAFSFAYDNPPPTTLTIANGTPTFPATQTVYRNDHNINSGIFTLTATGGTVTVTSVVYRATTGAANVGPGGCVYLYLDTNGNGQWDAGDQQLDIGDFTGTDATLTPATPITIPNGTTQTFLVVYDIMATATPGQTINGNVFSIASNAGVTSGTDPNDSILTVGTLVLTVTDLPNPASKNAQQGSQNNAVGKFTLSTNFSSATVTQIVITGTNTAFVDAQGVNIWQDVNGNNEWDAGDSMVAGNVSFSGTTATFNGAMMTATPTPVGYIITYDIAAGATVGGTTTGYISSISSDANTNTNNDNTVDATLTITAGTCVRTAPLVEISPSTAFAPPNDAAGYTVSVTNRDNNFCGTTTFAVALTNTPTVPNANYSSSSLGATSTGALAPGGNWQTTLTHATTVGATVGATQQSFVTTTDANHAAVQSNTVVTTVSAGWTNSALLHNSINTQSTAWTGSWGVPNGKYGGFVCTTCHGRQTGNIKRIRQAIVSESTHTWPNGSTTTGPISFTSATAGSSNFAKTAAPFNGVCNVCHSPTYHTFYSYNSSNGHEAGNDCTGCHKHNKGFSGSADAPCMNCHDAAQTGTYNPRQVVGGTAGNPGDDFIRLSRHVSDGTANQIVTSYDCVVCHAEGDANKVAAGTGWTSALHMNGTTSLTRMVKLRSVDNISTVFDYNKNILAGAVTATTTAMRNNMDTFCMNCHDLNGASAIAVNNTNPASGLILGTPTTTTVRAVVGANNANPKGITVNLRPFNTSDNLRNGRDTAWTAQGAETMGTRRTSTYGRVLNVKDQFNSTNVAGSNWASHHNLNQYAKRYSTKVLAAAVWTTYVTKEGQAMNSATVGVGGEVAGLHCSDCHLNETNAHGSRNAWYMNQSNNLGVFTPGNEPDITPTTTGQATSTSERMCFRCHNANVYGANSTAATNARYSHNTRCASGSVGASAGTQVFGATCYACHGGYSINTDGTVTGKGGLGAIHGTNENYNPGNGATASKRYRFMSGGTMRFYNPNGTTAYSGTANWGVPGGTAVGCYTVSSSNGDVFGGGCSSHASGVTLNKNNTAPPARALDY